MKPSLSIEGKTAVITLNNPESANRLTVDDLDTLQQHIFEVNQNQDIGVLVIKSTGKYFCSGFDISSLDESAKEKSLMFEVGVYGGATDLVLACDFRIGSQAAEMFMPAAKLGIHFYQRGLVRYVSRLGIDTAKRLLLTAEKIQSAEMKDIGFLTQLVKPEDLDSAIDKLIQQLMVMAPLAILGMKKHINRIANNTLNVDELNQDIALAQNSEDLQEGRSAWAEKRAPVFKGR